MARESTLVTLTIAAAGVNSNELITADFAFGMLKMPAAMTGTAFTIQGKMSENDSFEQIVNDAGVALSIVFTASSKTRIPNAAFGCYSIRLVSNGAEAAARTLFARLTS